MTFGLQHSPVYGVSQNGHPWCAADCRRPSPSQAHCAAAGCHRTFGSVTDFDRHRRAGERVDPAALGLVEVAGLWASPERHALDEVRTRRLRQNPRFRVLPTSVDAIQPEQGPVIPSKINNADLPHETGEAA